jgi:DNA (cytosine-5)-methyltransferase 1
MGFTFIDLFCGIGGFHRAMAALGGRCVFACDIDKSCRENYAANFGMTPHDDIRTAADIPNHDILCAGFPCFVAGTPVLTETGYKAIEDVQLSDRLLTHTNEFKPIVNLQRKLYTGVMHLIRLKYHAVPIVCTDEHPFYVRTKVKIWNNQNRSYDTKFAEPSWKLAKDVTRNDYVGMTVNTKSVVPEFTFTHKVNASFTTQRQIRLDCLDAWFMIGYFVGDGWIEDTKKADGRLHYKIRFAINTADESEVVSRISKILPITDKKCNTGECRKYGCANLEWHSLFSMFGKYAHGKRIPEWVQDAPIECIQEFIKGYIKSDGCILSNGTIQITTVSQNLALGVQRLFLKCGRIAGISKTIRSPTHTICAQTVNQRDTYTIRLCQTSKSSSFIEDGYVWFAPFKHTTREAISEPVYNFEVETDNSYIVENAIVHNCQPFSSAGNRAGFTDQTRGTLFYEIIRILADKKPRAFLLENVKHIQKIQSGQVYRTILAALNEVGYSVSVVVLSPDDFGVPQHRERVYFLGVRRPGSICPEMTIPECTTVSILEKDVSTKYAVNQDVKDVISAWNETLPILKAANFHHPVICEYFRNQETDLSQYPSWKRLYIQNNRKLYAANPSFWDGWEQRHNAVLSKRAIYKKLEWQVGEYDDSIWNHFIQLRQSGIRVKKADRFPTLVAMVQTPIYGPEKRFLTPRECARLQSFPDSHKLAEKDQHAYKHLGNSVNVNVVEFVGRQLLAWSN